MNFSRFIMPKLIWERNIEQCFAHHGSRVQTGGQAGGPPGGQPQPPPAALATAPPALVGHGDGAVIWRHGPRSESGPAASDMYRPVQRSGAAGGLRRQAGGILIPGPGPLSGEFESAASLSSDDCVVPA
jgi:hypothetical protein